MYSLYIDTHATNIELCLYKDGKIMKTSIKESVQQHSVHVLPMIRALLGEFKLKPRDLGLLLVNNGPGSFTGVRIGVTIAKTMAYTLHIPIKTVDSLLVKAISIDKKEKLVSLVDKHGAYVGHFDEANQAVEKYRYISTKEYEEATNQHTYVDDVEIDYEKVYDYATTIKETPAHAVNPLYVKNVEVSNGKGN